MTSPITLSDGEVWRIYQGDALDLFSALPNGSIGAVVTDPPFGMAWDTDSTRFTGGKGYHKKTSKPVHGDNQPFDPSLWLAVSPKIALWGSNHYAAKLPTGTTLVWCKKPADKFGKLLSDCEVGWCSGGVGVYMFHHIWDGCARESENGEHYHPTQKPVALMLWIMERLGVPVGATVLDPFCGSGSTGVACLRSGRRFIGFEQDVEYCDIARRRLAREQAQPSLPLFASTAPVTRQEAMVL